MAIETRSGKPDTVMHSDHGAVLTSWDPRNRAKEEGLVAPMEAVGWCLTTVWLSHFGATSPPSFATAKLGGLASNKSTQ